MRFKTKFDRWLVVTVVAGVAAGFGAPILVMTQLPASNPLFWVLPFLPLIGVIALAASLPQYYEVREDGLFIRQGWKKVLLPYQSLMELRKESSLYSAPVFSSDRILISASTGVLLIIAVAEKERFLHEVLQRAPELKEQLWGLAVPVF